MSYGDFALNGLLVLVALLTILVVVSIILYLLFAVVVAPSLRLPWIPIEKDYADTLYFRDRKIMEDGEFTIFVGEAIWAIAIVLTALLTVGYVANTLGVSLTP